MRARALAQCLDADLSVSVRGGAAARAAATLVGPLVDGRDALKAADLLILDDPSRELGQPWVARAKRAGIRSVSIHDDHWAQAADLVVCGSLGAPRPKTRSAVLHGTEFYLLDRRIAGVRPAAPRAAARRTRVIVALGGGEHVRRVAQPLADAIHAACPATDVAIAAGFGRGPRPRLKNARWLSARTGLVRALAGADVAIVAGGVTLYEACALGIPAVGLAVVPAQRRAIRRFAAAGALLDGGDASRKGDGLLAAARSVAALAANRRLRDRMAGNARRLVDGKGAERVARHIEALLGKARRG
jgi:spore coat polysaccharide biosynthesis predicted glycosyltransferase SpsG